MKQVASSELSLMMEATCSSKTSVYFQRTTQCYIPEDKTLDVDTLCVRQIDVSVCFCVYKRIGFEYGFLCKGVLFKPPSSNIFNGCFRNMNLTAQALSTLYFKAEICISTIFLQV